MENKTEKLVFARKAGPLRNGFERRKGTKLHLVSETHANCGGTSICGARPAIAWSEIDDSVLRKMEYAPWYCEKCLEIQEKGEKSL